MKPFLSEEEIQACPPTIVDGVVMVKEGDYVVRTYGSSLTPRGTVFQIDKIVGRDAYMLRVGGRPSERPCLYLNRCAIYSPVAEHEPL